MPPSSNNKKKNPAVDLIAGGTAGLFEALCCHWLDTIKVRMQLQRKTGAKPAGFVRTGINIVKDEGFLALYKGLGAVCIGIVPKMAIRFTSYEFYRNLLRDDNGSISTGSTFIAGVGAGTTEAVLVVTPMDLVKIRLQAQKNSEAAPKYKNAVHCGYVIIKEEGFSALFRGVTLTAARQASNQGVNFTVYSKLKEYLQKEQNTQVLPSWQTSGIGLISGALGPLSNAPLDTIKTRMQRETGKSTESGLARMTRIARVLIAEEGFNALYKGITPRIMRVAPGQAVTFTVYELMQGVLDKVPYIGSQQTVFEK
ncbi:Sfc1p [Ascoidea rubescens DSM 1968]|uniref:Mitochondrial carrier n=1 Tax=Ascoidea rubescens DSM 1968 TaxID=1344418 RepID=A0A1D2VJK9_9ASCO|nr:mitochondrial carrier [Ascoidea rubescens DSM 1968]ODV61760.1 mitochondrial carrier [Ascoidea rubescens DSM 1968]